MSIFIELVGDYFLQSKEHLILTKNRLFFENLFALCLQNNFTQNFLEYIAFL